MALATKTHYSDQEEDQDIPSSFVRGSLRWAEQTLMNVEEHVEAPSSTFRESRL